MKSILYERSSLPWRVLYWRLHCIFIVEPLYGRHIGTNKIKCPEYRGKFYAQRGPNLMCLIQRFPYYRGTCGLPNSGTSKQWTSGPGIHTSFSFTGRSTYHTEENFCGVKSPWFHQNIGVIPSFCALFISKPRKPRKFYPMEIILYTALA